MRTGPHKVSPAGMEPLGSERHRPWPTRVSFREKANQSKCASTNYPKSLSHTGYTKRPRRESNPHLRFRKPSFYPLNYGDSKKGKSKKDEGKIQRSDFRDHGSHPNKH